MATRCHYSQILFDSDQTYELLRCLTEIELSLWGPIHNGKNDGNGTLHQARKNSEVNLVLLA